MYRRTRGMFQSVASKGPHAAVDWMALVSNEDTY